VRAVASLEIRDAGGRDDVAGGHDPRRRALDGDERLTTEAVRANSRGVRPARSARAGGHHRQVDGARSAHRPLPGCGPAARARADPDQGHRAVRHHGRSVRGRGTRTKRPGETLREGFYASLGHGVGLAVHEPPLLGRTGTAPLIAGDVIAIQPGLVDRSVGGVRVEELLVVTEDGAERLTGDFPYGLVP
jgi:hypothetical protein